MISLWTLIIIDVFDASFKHLALCQQWNIYNFQKQSQLLENL